MKIVGFLVLLVLSWGVFSNAAISRNVSSRPLVVNIGAIFTFNSVIGRVAKVAIEAAVEDINSNSSVLGGTKLVVSMQDSDYSGLVGIMEALQFMATDIVAIVGPQADVLAHVISHVANELQVPLLSFAATDPTLSSLQYPFFVRTTQSDLFQMSAVADLVDYYNWKNVIAIYVDDDHGRNGIAALGDKLAEKRCKISYKAGISPIYKAGVSPQLGRDEVMNILVQVALMESRIIVVHTYLNTGLVVLSVAQHLGMMGNGYVWIATDWLSTVVDSSPSLSMDTISSMQGVITLRQHTADSKLKSDFVSRWSLLTRKRRARSLKLNTYGLYAYDTVWMLAHAMNAFLSDGGTISFSNDSRLQALGGSTLNLEAMSIFDGGNLLLKEIYQINRMGVTGLLQFDADRFLVRPAYDIINVIGTGIRNIGYWSNYSGLSIIPPETLYLKPPNRSSSNQQLLNVIWPGDATTRPRGWVFPNNGKELRIGIPNRVSYRAFVSQVNNSNTVRGFCIDVFTAALNLLPYAVPYRFIPFGDGKNNPSYTELVTLITKDVFDAVVGDIAIVTNRTKIVDFTQPFIESGLVIVAPMKRISSSAWAFLRPFTLEMWGVTAVFFLIVGTVVWILEHRLNDEFRGPPKRQVVTILWFSFSTMFFAHRENTVSTLGRMVLLIWLFVVLIIQSSYTASLTSILTVQQLSSPISGIDSLIKSDVPVGFQVGSFAENYLHEELGIAKSRLVSLGRREDYAKALEKGPENGGVAAVVDELPYVQLFLSRQCKYKIIGPEFTKSGWGFVLSSTLHLENCGNLEHQQAEDYFSDWFAPKSYQQYVEIVNGVVKAESSISPDVASDFILHQTDSYLKCLQYDAFPRDSPLAVDLSTAILQLSENGDLQRIHDKWLSRTTCSSDSTELESNQLHLKSFVGLYFLCGLVCFIALLLYFVLVVRQFSRDVPDEPVSSDQGSSRSRRLQKFFTFADEKEETVKSRSKRRQMEQSSRGSTNTETRHMEKTDSNNSNLSLSPHYLS